MKLRYEDFRTVTRRVTLVEATDLAEVLYHEASKLLKQEVRAGAEIRLVGISAGGLVEGGYQLSLFGGDELRLRRLSKVVDDIRDRYGDGALRRASLLRGRGKDQREEEE